jgi:hypothetical protein
MVPSAPYTYYSGRTIWPFCLSLYARDRRNYFYSDNDTNMAASGYWYYYESAQLWVYGCFLANLYCCGSLSNTYMMAQV